MSTFPTSPLRTGRAAFTASGSPVTHEPIAEMGICVTYAPFDEFSCHLSSFALSAAFPLSAAGRDSRDYYEDSVTLGLASRR